MRIQINHRGITNLKAGLTTGEVGETDYPDGPEFRGWLDGQIARGAVSLVSGKPAAKAKPGSALAKDLADADKTQHPDGVDGEPVVAAEVPAAYAESALGPTSGATPEVSGPGAVDVDVSKPRGEPEQVHADGAEGLTIGSTSGPAPAPFDLAKDLADADKTQHPEQTEALRGKPGEHQPRRAR